MVLNNVLLKKIEGFKQFVANMIPIAGNHTPSSDTTNGSSGTNMDYARSDHAHPKSNLYAESVHTHTINDLPSTIIDDTDIGDIIDTLNTDDIFTYSNKNVGQTGNIICLIGKLYGDDIEGKTIEFYNGNTLLGSSNTDTYGTALYDYTCTGSGKKEITTKHGNSVSTPYEVLDCIFKDYGGNPKWFITQTGAERTVNSNNEITFNNPNTSSYTLAYPYTVATLPSSWNDKVNAMKILNGSVNIEFKLISVSARSQIAVRVGNGSNDDVFGSGANFLWTAGSDILLKFDADNNKVYCYVDGVKQSHELSYNLNQDYYFCFSVSGGQNITMKDFKIYPI